MKRTVLLLAIAAVVVALLIVLMGIDLAGAESPASPSPSPSVTASPSPSPTATPVPPASAATVAKALRAQKQAKAARRALCRVRSCFGSHAPVKVAPRPERSASEAVWTQATKRWQHQREDWLAKVKQGLHDMRNPGGTSSGVRWMPLARYVGWPEKALHTLSGMIMCESSGRERAISPTQDYGLTQLNKCHAAKFRQVIGKPFYSAALIAEHNLRFALYIYHVVQHDHFKPAWARDDAVEAVE